MVTRILAAIVVLLFGTAVVLHFQKINSSRSSPNEYLQATCKSIGGEYDSASKKCKRAPTLEKCSTIKFDLKRCMHFTQIGAEKAFGQDSMNIPEGIQGETFTWEKQSAVLTKAKICGVHVQCLAGQWRPARAIVAHNHECHCGEIE